MFTTVPIAMRVIPKAVRADGRFAALTTALLACSLCALTSWAQAPEMRTMFRVRHVAEGVAYIDAGNNAGLAEGMKLVIKRQATISTDTGNGEAKANIIIAELRVASVAETSAVCDIEKKNRDIIEGDLAYLTQNEIESLVQKRALSSTRAYPMVVSFTEGDPLDEDVRASVPKPPSPEINRARGRIGLDYSGTSSRSTGSDSDSSQVGIIIRTEVLRVGGTYWNLSGYWRGRLSNNSGQQDGIQDLMARTYHMGMTYSNPNSRWVAGFGRMNIPWANSLDTIDGGYVGRKLGKHATTGIFAGSLPDPTSWDYAPDRTIAGSFVNLEGGSFDSLRYTSTFGLAVTALRWHIDRPMAFAENGIFYKQIFSVYQTIQADQPHNPQVADAGAGVSRSYLTVRIQPNHHISFDVNHNYFRDVPTYDPRLIATGLVDKLLFQGLSVGTRVELPDHITLYANLGKSSRSGDTRSSLNSMYGVTFGRIWRTGIRADMRYSQFDSAFGSGNYRALSLSRNFGDNFRWEVQGGKQVFISPLTTDRGSMFMNTLLDMSFGSHYFMEAGYTMQRGQTQDIDQWYSTLGYRFDNRARGPKQ
jgi:hypothetical protein